MQSELLHLPSIASYHKASISHVLMMPDGCMSVCSNTWYAEMQLVSSCSKSKVLVDWQNCDGDKCGSMLCCITCIAAMAPDAMFEMTCWLMTTQGLLIVLTS